MGSLITSHTIEYGWHRWPFWPRYRAVVQSPAILAAKTPNTAHGKWRWRARTAYRDRAAMIYDIFDGDF